MSFHNAPISVLERIALAVVAKPLHQKPINVVPPRVPLSVDGFIVDQRPKAREPWLSPVTLRNGRKVRFEIADMVDFATMGQLMNHELCYNTNISKAVGATYDNLSPLNFDLLAHALPSRGSLLGFFEDKLVCCRCVHYMEGSEVRSRLGFAKENPQLSFQQDYLEAVQAAPYESVTSKLIFTFLSECENQTGQFLPPDLSKLAFAEAVCVHDSFKSQGLGAAISAAAEALARANGCSHVVSVAVARDSTAIAEKKKFRQLFAFPFDKFVVAGELPFGQMHDRSKAASVFLGTL